MATIKVEIAIAQEDRDRIDALIAATIGGTGKPAGKKAAAKKPAAEETEPAVEESDGPDRGDVRKALKAHAALEGKEAAIAILKKHGAASITELDEAEFVAVIADCGD